MTLDNDLIIIFLLIYFAGVLVHCLAEDNNDILMMLVKQKNTALFVLGLLYAVGYTLLWPLRFPQRVYRFIKQFFTILKERQK